FGDDSKNNANLNFESVTPGYFDTMRIALCRGRLFSARDTLETTPVAIVSESTARRLWPGQDPIGKRLTLPDGRTADGKFPLETVVGVVADVRYRGLDDNRFDVYLPWTQANAQVKHLMVRTTGDPALVAKSLQQAIGAETTPVVVEPIEMMDRAL